jgi:hypothetical protein
MAAAMTLEAETSDALAVQRTLPDDALRIAASGEQKDGAPSSDAKRRLIPRFTDPCRCVDHTHALWKTACSSPFVFPNVDRRGGASSVRRADGRLHEWRFLIERSGEQLRAVRIGYEDCQPLCCEIASGVPRAFAP